MIARILSDTRNHSATPTHVYIFSTQQQQNTQLRREQQEEEYEQVLRADKERVAQQKAKQEQERLEQIKLQEDQAKKQQLEKVFCVFFRKWENKYS